MRVLTPIKAIRAKCMDCSNNQFKEIRFCPIDDCPLYPYRMGRRPKRVGTKSEDSVSCSKLPSRVGAT